MNIDTIFDALGKASKIIQITNQYQDKIEQIKSVQSKRCGNCGHWMKSSCVPEKRLNQFKSAGSLACTVFTIAYNSNYLIKEFNKELHEIKLRLNGINKDTI